MASPFYDKIYSQVRRIPSGKVTNYATVAAMADMRRGARVVGWALRTLPADTDVPWQRVVNKAGHISIVNPKFPKTVQRILLEDEGVTIHEENGWYTIDQSAWWDPS